MLDYSKLCKDAIALTGSIELTYGRPHNIIFAGMGGSGISGYLLKDILRDSFDIPVEVSGDYDLPATAGPQTLFICTSYSGNTEETLTQFTHAVRRKCNIVSITSGGKLLEWSQKLGIPCIKLPSGYQPRDALPYLFFSLTACLERLGLKDFSSDKEEFLAIIPTIEMTSIEEIAIAIKGSKYPLIYGPSKFLGVLRRIASQLAENSKMLSKFSELPELNHNEVVGYEIDSHPDVSIIFVRDREEKPEIGKRIQITREIAQGRVNTVHDIWSYGNSQLAKVMSLVYQGDYLSFKLAEIKSVNREQVKTIDKVKQDLKELGTVERLEREFL